MIPISVTPTPAIGWQIFAMSIVDMISGFFEPSTNERIARMKKFCSDPKTFDPQVCGVVPWGSINCGSGTPDFSSLNEYGAPTRCLCPLSAIFVRGQSGCGPAQAIKDNMGTILIGGILFYVILLR